MNSACASARNFIPKHKKKHKATWRSPDLEENFIQKRAVENYTTKDSVAWFKARKNSGSCEVSENEKSANWPINFCADRQWIFNRCRIAYITFPRVACRGFPLFFHHKRKPAVSKACFVISAIKVANYCL